MLARKEAGRPLGRFLCSPAHSFFSSTDEKRSDGGGEIVVVKVIFRYFARFHAGRGYRQTKDSDFRDDSSCVASAEADLQLPIFFERQSSQRGHLSTQCGEVADADADR